jgi:acetyl-CoA C-acetyltransferase
MIEDSVTDSSPVTPITLKGIIGGYSETGLYIVQLKPPSLAAYKEAGVKNARKEISMMEVHDCFSITELTIYEDLGISPRGRAKEDIEAGFYDLNGTIPCQPDGGLKCFGHPIGATGLRMLYEMYKQLQGKAEARQIKDPKIGLTHNIGGFPSRAVVSVTMLAFNRREFRRLGKDLKYGF